MYLVYTELFTLSSQWDNLQVASQQLPESRTEAITVNMPRIMHNRCRRIASCINNHQRCGRGTIRMRLEAFDIHRDNYLVQIMFDWEGGRVAAGFSN